MWKQEVHAIKGISYVFESGKVYSIMGKSGRGKTTLLSMMGGLLMPTEGRIFIDNIEVKKRKWNDCGGY